MTVNPKSIILEVDMEGFEEQEGCDWDVLSVLL